MRKRHGPIAALALLLVAAPLQAQLGDAARAPLRVRIERAVDALRTHQDTSGVTGLSAAFAVDGRLVWAGGFGWADLENQVPMSAATVSRIGSISKPVAAVAAMVLVDRGRLDLDAPVSTYLPRYPQPQARITMRQLMSHSAGIRHYADDEEFYSNIRYDDVVEPMTLFWSDPLLFEPGTDYSYSTFGWTVVSAVTEAADGGRSWLELMDAEVFEPLGLTSMQAEWTDSIIPHRASYYDRSGDGWVNSRAVDNSNKWAGGGLVSNAIDLVNFALALAEGRVLSDEARAESWRQQTPAGETAYGLGWRIAEFQGHRVVSHSGGSVGATAMLVLLPDDGIAIAILGNTSDISHGGIAATVMRILLGAE